jgi:NSS family neurotransmitter:Na+ symporter
MEKHKRGQWASNLGFVLATAGAAVGLGNIWKFPYLAGQNGGGAFVLVYILLVIIMGFTITLAEMSVGRATGKNCVGAFRQLNKKFSFVGGLGVFTGFIILSYYSVIGGWVFKYIITYITGANFGGDISGYFDSYVASPVMPVVFHILFMAATAFIVANGISGGIEKASKFMMPGLFLLLVVIAVRSCTLPGAAEGLKYFLVPDFSKLTPSVIVAAMGQVFFSLSLGMGITTTYGSYLSKHANIEKNCVMIPGLDTMAAMLSGLAIIPAVFAAFPGEGASHVGAGPSLMFKTLPAVFESMPMGVVFGLLFFILVAFAAVTSSVALLEGTVAFVVEEFHWSRTKAVVILASICALIGVAVSLSQGAMELNMPIWNFKDGVQWVTFFDFLSFLTDNLFLPIGGFTICIFVGYFWGIKNVVNEVEQNGKFKFHSQKLWAFSVRYFCPVALVLVFLNLLGILQL